MGASVARLFERFFLHFPVWTPLDGLAPDSKRGRGFFLRGIRMRSKTAVTVFNTEIAVQYGVNAAIIFERISSWISHNENAGINLKDDKYWTYNTRKGMLSEFPYMSEWDVRKGISELLKNDLIVTGRFNDNTLDRTTWYGLTEKGEKLYQEGVSRLVNFTNALENSTNPISTYEAQLNIDSSLLKDNKHCSKESFNNSLSGKIEKPYKNFAEAWELYPKKQGRKEAEAAYNRAIRDGTSHAEIMQGIKAYTEYIKGTKTEDRYVKQGSTFFRQNGWKDDWTVMLQASNDKNFGRYIDYDALTMGMDYDIRY